MPGAIHALAAFGLYSSHDAVVKSLGSSYTPFQILFFSVLLGFPLITLILMRDTSGGNLRPKHPWWSLLRAAAAVTTGICAFHAFSTLPLAQAYAIIFATPLLITILAIPVLGERVRIRRWIAVLVGLAGVLIVLQPGRADITLGHLAALGAAVGASCAAVVVRKIGQEERPVVLMLYPMVAIFILTALLQPFVYRPVPFGDFLKMGLVSVLGLCGALALIGAYRRSEAGIVAPMQYSQILWATLYGAVFFGETPDMHTVAGSAVIIASGLYILLRESRRPDSSSQPNLSTQGRVETGVQPRASVLLRFFRRR